MKRITYSDLRSELVSYAESSTIKGLPRLYKTKDPILKTLWLIFLIACTVVLCFFLYVAINKFNNWPVLTKFGEMVKGKIKFPDITICNLDAFAAGYPDILPVNTYLQMLSKNEKNVLDLLVMKKNFSKDYAQKMFNEFNSIPAYILNLPKNCEMNLDCPHFILQCQVHINNWPDDSIDCLESFERHWNPSYYACYTLKTSKLKAPNNNMSINGLNLLLNVGPPSVVQLPYQYSFTRSQARGVQVNVHSPGTPPSPKNGFSVAPGTENIVTIVQTEKHRMDKPYNELGCTHETILKVSPNERYTQDSCVEFCKQENILRNCGCVSHYLDVPFSYQDTTTMCGNFSLSSHLIRNIGFNAILLNENVSDSFECSQKYLKESCEYSCLIPCDETIYSTYLSTAAWPQYSLQMNIFETFIYNMNCTKNYPKVARRYKTYTEILERSNQTSDNLDADTETATVKLDQIQESLLTIKFIIKENMPYYIEEEEAYTYDRMIGVVGGILSLWLGVSAATAMEIMELVYKLLKKGC